MKKAVLPILGKQTAHRHRSPFWKTGNLYEWQQKTLSRQWILAPNNSLVMKVPHIRSCNMKRLWQTPVAGLAGLFLTAMYAMPQAYTISARPGGVNYIEGQAYLNAQPLSEKGLKWTFLNASDTLSTDIGKVHQAFSQSVADTRAVADWLATLPDVDSHRLGLIGVSLGAIVMQTAMGRDSRFSAGVAILGGADFPDLYRRSILFRILHPGTTRPLTEKELALLREVDPLTYTDRNRPRRVLMIQGARDDIIGSLAPPPCQIGLRSLSRVS